MSLGVPQEFYVDGQPMCCARAIVAGVENANVTNATAEKAWATSKNRSGPLYHNTVVFKCLMVSLSLWVLRDADQF